jgi:hypothetical protein
VHGRRCGRCHCLDSGGPLCASLSHPLLISSLTLLISRQLMLIYARCVCFMRAARPPACLSIISAQHNGVCHRKLPLAHGLAQFEAQIASERFQRSERARVNLLLMLAAIPMTMTLMRKCVCIALYTISLVL